MVTTISATASVRVRGGRYSPKVAAAVASVLGNALGSALASAPVALVDDKRKPRAASIRNTGDL